MGSLDRKVVLVTGSNTGIGYETVKALLQSEKLYHVFLCSRYVARGQQALEQLQKECPAVANTVQLLQLDVADDESIQKAYDEVKTTVGRLDVLINNAGIVPSMP